MTSPRTWETTRMARIFRLIGGNRPGRAADGVGSLQSFRELVHPPLELLEGVLHRGKHQSGALIPDGRRVEVVHRIADFGDRLGQKVVQLLRGLELLANHQNVLNGELPLLHGPKSSWERGKLPSLLHGPAAVYAPPGKLRMRASICHNKWEYVKAAQNALFT
jgi:hypothetical protein